MPEKPLWRLCRWEKGSVHSAFDTERPPQTSGTVDTDEGRAAAAEVQIQMGSRFVNRRHSAGHSRKATLFPPRLST